MQMAKKEFNPLTFIPSAEVIREQLAETLLLAERLKILLRTSEEIAAAKVPSATACENDYVSRFNLGLTRRIESALEGEGICTAEDLAKRTEKEVSEIRNIGELALFRIKKYLATLGLKFRVPE